MRTRKFMMRSTGVNISLLLLAIVVTISACNKRISDPAMQPQPMTPVKVTPPPEGQRIPVKFAMKLLVDEAKSKNSNATTTKFPIWMTQKNVNAR